MDSKQRGRPLRTPKYGSLIRARWTALVETHKKKKTTRSASLLLMVVGTTAQLQMSRHSHHSKFQNHGEHIIVNDIGIHHRGRDELDGGEIALS